MRSPYSLESDPSSLESESEFDFEAEPEFVFEDGTPSGCEKALVLAGFEPGGYQLRPDHYEPLRQFVDQLKSNPPDPSRELVLIGFADEPGASEPSGGLGLHRALEVRRFLTPLLEQNGIDLHVTARGDGDQGEPPAGETDGAPEQGGRVDLLFCPSTGEPSGPAAVEPLAAEPTEPTGPEPLEPIGAVPVPGRRRLLPVWRWRRRRHFMAGRPTRRRLRQRPALRRPSGRTLTRFRRRPRLLLRRGGLARFRRPISVLRRRAFGRLRRPASVLQRRGLSGFRRPGSLMRGRGLTRFVRRSPLGRRRGITPFRRPGAALGRRPAVSSFRSRRSVMQRRRLASSSRRPGRMPVGRRVLRREVSEASMG